MNIVKKIEAALDEVPFSVKTFASHQFAEARGEKLGKRWDEIHNANEPIQYIPVFLPRHKRWTVIFNCTEHSRLINKNGYALWFSDQGFWII